MLISIIKEFVNLINFAIDGSFIRMLYPVGIFSNFWLLFIFKSFL